MGQAAAALPVLVFGNFWRKLVLLSVQMDCSPWRRRWAGWMLAVAGMAAAGMAMVLPAGAATTATEGADDSSNPYSIIVERNVFHLNPPPPPPEPDKPKVDLPVVKITGMVEMGGKEKVLFSSTCKEKKDISYYSLAEGSKSDDGRLQLVKIHPEKDAVDVMNDGVLVTLTLKDDAASPGSGPAPAVAPGAKGGPPPAQGPGPAGRPMFGRSLPNLPGGLAYPMRPRRGPQ